MGNSVEQELILRCAGFPHVFRCRIRPANQAKQDPEFPGSISVDYLDLVGHVVCAWCWALMASNATGDDFGRAKTITAQFFYERLLPRSLGLAENIRATNNVAMQMPAELF